MSQYPSPYIPPNVTPNYVAAADLLKPAKRASILLFVLGGLMTACFLLSTVDCAIEPASSFGEQLQQMQKMQQVPMTQQQLQLMPTAQQFKSILVGMSVLCVVCGLVLIALGVGVRRGGKISTIAAMVYCGLLLAGTAVIVLIGLISSLSNPAALGSVCILAIPCALLTWLILWLIPALRAQSSMKAAQSQLAAQYWQYQQSMQAYMAYGQQMQPMPPPQSMGYPMTGGYPTHPGYPQQPQLPPAQAPVPPPPADGSSPPTA